MKNISIHIPTFFFCLLFLSCEQNGVGTYESKNPVVEGYIFAGQSVDSLRITQSISYAQEDSFVITLDDLNPSISDGTNSYPLNSIGNGYYQNLNLVIEPEISYQLSFDYADGQVSAVTYIPKQRTAQISSEVIEVEKIAAGSFPPRGNDQEDPVEVAWNNEEGDYYYVVIDNLEEDPVYINELIQQFLEENGGLVPFRQFSQPEVSDFHAINPQRDLQQFGKHRVIVYRVNPEYAALYESTSSSSQNISEPPSNITNGLGIFTGLSSDTLFFDVKEK